MQVDYHEVSPTLGLADSMFVHDTAFMTNKGAIVCIVRNLTKEVLIVF